MRRCTVHWNDEEKSRNDLKFFRAHGGWTGLRIFSEQFFTGKRSGGGSRDQSALRDHTGKSRNGRLCPALRDRVLPVPVKNKKISNFRETTCTSKKMYRIIRGIKAR